MSEHEGEHLADTGERMIPPEDGELSFVWERHRFAYAYASTFCHGRRVLDVGCGTGYGAHLLAQHAEHVVAIDNSPDAIAYCRRNFSAPNLEFFVCEASDVPGEAAFDVAVSFQVIEHVPDPAEFLKRMRGATAPGGTILVTTPNVRTPPPVSANPFHMSEMNAEQLESTARAVFDHFEIRGVGYARTNMLRRVLQQTPLYSLGRMLKRSSSLKRVADRTLDLRGFEVITEGVDARAIDLLLVAYLDEPQPIRS